jgi:hypothetical protein
MTTLFYMPYFDSDNHRMRDVQEPSLKFFNEVLQDSLEDLYDVKFLLQKNTGASEDRLPYFASIWGQYNIFMIESTKVPTIKQVVEILNCRHDLCTQEYITKVPRKPDPITRKPNWCDFYAHKYIVDNWVPITEGCDMTIPEGKGNYHLRYAKLFGYNDPNSMCDVTDLGIVKISKALQERTKPDFMASKVISDYNTVERIHDWIFRNCGFRAWHSHHDTLAWRNPELIHVRTSERWHESEYWNYDEYAKVFFKPQPSP